MFRHITILLKADCYAWWNGVKHDKQSWRKNIFKIIGYVFFITSLSVLGWTLFKHLRIADASSQTLLNVINGFMLFGIIIVAKELMESTLKILYEAPDTVLLHTTPIPQATIFAYKFIHISTTRLLSIFCFLGPPWIVFGLIYQLPWHFYAVLFPISVGLLVIIASYVTISMMVIARFFSSSALLVTLKTLGAVIGIIVGFLLSFTLLAGSDFFPIKDFLLNLTTKSTAESTRILYPHEWIGKILISWGNETSALTRLKWIVGGLGISIISVGLAFLISQWIYKRGWENIRQLKTRRRPARKNVDVTAQQLSGFATYFGRGKIQSLMVKDFLIYIRHTGRVLAIIMLTCFLVVHIGVLISDSTYPDDFATEILLVQILLYSLLITFGISCNGLRDEAKTWWMMRSAPVKPHLLFTSKFMISLLCSLIYTEFWVIISVILLRLPAENWILLLVIPIITLPIGCVLNTTIGTLPWMAELTRQPKPLLRVLTFTVTLFLDVVIIVAPIIAWHAPSILIFLLLILLLAAIFVMLYSIGIRNLLKFLVPQ